MEILIAIGSINAFFFALVIFGKRNRKIADYWLSILFIVLGISFGIVYLSFILKLPVLQLFVWNIGLLIGPLLYLYAYQLVNNDYRRKSHVKKTSIFSSWRIQRAGMWASMKPSHCIRYKYLINFLPYLVSWVYLACLLVFNSENEIKDLFNSSLNNTNAIFLFFTIIETLSIPFYVVLIFRLYRKDSKKISHTNVVSTPDCHFEWSAAELRNVSSAKPKLRWLRVLIIAVLIMWMIINSLYYISPLDSEISIKYGFGLSSAIIFYLGYIIHP